MVNFQNTAFQRPVNYGSKRYNILKFSLTAKRVVAKNIIIVQLGGGEFPKSFRETLGTSKNKQQKTYEYEKNIIVDTFVIHLSHTHGAVCWPGIRRAES